MKNKTMRIAALLLALTLMTSCFVGGTFAKYTTADDASDSARVAKWGVVATVTGTAFAGEYDTNLETAAKNKNGDDITKVVVTSTNEDLVAPGTKGTFTGVSVTGTPEVAVNIETEATIILTGWTLTDDTFYCPIVINVNGKDYCGLDYKSADAFVSALTTAIETANGNYEAKTDLSAVTGLNGNYSWEWAFVNDVHSCDTDAVHVVDQSDGRDTELGNQAARGTLNKIEITVSCTITQID